MFPETPIGEGAKRALVNALIAFIYTAFLTYQGILKVMPTTPTNDAVRDSIVAGVIFALSPFVVQVAQGAMDQRRVEQGKVLPSDVPIQITARVQNISPEVVAGDFAPTNIRRSA